MANLRDIAQVTSKCIFCSNMIIKWNFNGAELSMFCALSRDMRAQECDAFELVRPVTCSRCGARNEPFFKFCSECGARLR
ncbi:MAG: zinc-ribbon domain-containing protein [Euryarchaeota archaeon]|nr:zinc-ribbon domain-containing protein [Euryarchaeota archaeon]